MTKNNNIMLQITAISKQYRLGTIGTGTISHDLERWWYKVRGKEDPFLKIGEKNVRDSKASSEYVWALKDITFNVYKGDVIGIIGKNGAGKSTLLKILSKITAPTTGCIKSRGRIASLLEVGTGFHPELTGAENIFLNGAILGMTKEEISSKFDEIVAFSGVERYIDTPVKRYSSGMKVRLAFAVAAHLEPEILIIDEVLAVGDAEFQKKAIGKMQDISNEDGRTVLFVSHNMSAVKSLCSRAIILEDGTVAFDGSVTDGIDFYTKLSQDSLGSKQEKIFNNGYVELLDFAIFHKGTRLLSGASVALGESLDIQLQIKINYDIADLSIAFDVNNMLGELYAHISNEDDAFFVPNIKEGALLTIHIKTNPIVFIPNIYSLNLWIGSAQVSTYLNIKSIFSFEVIQGEFTKRTKSLPRHSRVFLGTKWQEG